MGLERAAAMILGRAMSRDQRSLVWCGDRDRLTALDRYLWEHDPDSFLPHGLASAPDAARHAARQPIWLSPEWANPNQAVVALVLDGGALQPGWLEDMEIVCDLFSGHDPDAVAAARQRWVGYRDAGFRLSYWEEGDGGGWERRAEHQPP